MKERRDRPVIRADMSPKAVERRLRDWGQLFKLASSLKNVKLVGKTEELRKAETRPRTD